MVKKEGRGVTKYMPVVYLTRIEVWSDPFFCVLWNRKAALIMTD